MEWIDKIVRRKNPSDFERDVELVYLVVDVYKGTAELWPYFDEKKKGIVEEKLIKMVESQYGFPEDFGVSGMCFRIPDEVYVPVEKLGEEFVIVNSEAVRDLWKRGILPEDVIEYLG